MATPQYQFSQPDDSVGDKFDTDQLNGHLLLFYPGLTKVVMTKQYGEKEAINADVIVLDVVDPATGHPPVLNGTLIFNAVLIGQLKEEGKKGGMVLGRLGQGANTKGNAPWLLNPFTDAEAGVASTYLATHKREAFVQPQGQTPPAPAATAWGAAPQAAPAQQQWGAPPAQQAPPAPPLGYDPWQNTPAAATPPAGPPVQQQWGAPPPAAAAPAPASSPGAPWGAPQQNGPAAPSAPAATAAPAAPALDPGLVAFLQGKGVTDFSNMTQASAEMLARSFPA